MLFLTVISSLLGTGYWIMLVLTRKISQSIIIDKEISVEIIEIRGNSVRIGIKAPKNIKIMRAELIKKT